MKVCVYFRWLPMVTGCLLFTACEQGGMKETKPITEDETTTLIAQLKHADRTVRSESARALGERKASEALKPLTALLSDDHRQVRHAAIWSLTELSDPRSVPALTEALETAPDSGEVFSLVEALYKIGDPRAMDVVANAIGGDGPRMPDYLIDGLSPRPFPASFRDERIRQALLKRLKTDQDRIDSSAADLLRREFHEPSLYEPLVEALQADVKLDRSSAAHMLERLGDRRAIEPLKAAMMADPSCRAACARALCRFGVEVDMSPILAVAMDEDAESPHRFNSVEALRYQGGREHLEALRELAERDIRGLPQISEEAIADIEVGAYEAWRRHGKETAIKRALSALEDGERSLRLAALRFLDYHRSEAVTEGVAPYTNDPDEQVAMKAIVATAGRRTPGCDKYLGLALEHGSDRVRSLALSALSEEGRKQAVEAILRFTESDNSSLRWQAVEALSEIREPRAVDILFPMLGDEDHFVRGRAAMRLKQFADSSLCPQIIEAFEAYDDWSVREELADALGRIRSAQSIAALEKWICDDHPTIIDAAARSLARLGWTPPNDELRRRYLIALRRMDEESELFDRATQIEGTRYQAEGAFVLDRPIISEMTIDFDIQRDVDEDYRSEYSEDYYEEIITIQRVEFRKKQDDLVGIVHLEDASYPYSEWGVSIDLFSGESSTPIATAECEHDVSKPWDGAPQQIRIYPNEIEFGEVWDVEAIDRFVLTVRYLYAVSY